MQDLRQVKSRDLLKKSFLELLETMPYRRISIADVTRLAGLNRKTFYGHYQEMDELLEDCLEAFFSQFTGNLTECILPVGETPSPLFDPVKYTQKYLAFVLEHKHFFQLLLENKLDTHAFHAFENVLFANTNTKEAFLKQNEPLNTDFHLELFLGYSLQGLWACMIWALNHADKSLDYLAQEAVSIFRMYLHHSNRMYLTSAADNK